MTKKHWKKGIPFKTLDIEVTSDVARNKDYIRQHVTNLALSKYLGLNYRGQNISLSELLIVNQNTSESGDNKERGYLGISLDWKDNILSWALNVIARFDIRIAKALIRIVTKSLISSEKLYFVPDERILKGNQFLLENLSEFDQNGARALKGELNASLDLRNFSFRTQAEIIERVKSEVSALIEQLSNQAFCRIDLLKVRVFSKEISNANTRKGMTKCSVNLEGRKGTNAIAIIVNGANEIEVFNALITSDIQILGTKTTSLSFAAAVLHPAKIVLAHQMSPILLRNWTRL